MSGVSPETRMEELEERLRDYLYRNNGKLTNERLAILHTLYRRNDHYTVDSIIEQAKQDGSVFSRATVYRTLDLLVQAGLAKKQTFRGQDTVYEAAHQSEHHDHVICVDCNKIIEFYNAELESIQNKILKELGFGHASHTHQLYGHCLDPNCPQKHKS